MAAVSKPLGKSTKLARPGGVTIAPHPPNRAGRLLFIDTDKIKPNPDQPRQEFDPEALQELADSLQEHGVLQPLAVQLAGDEAVLIAGERRLRAARLAGLAAVPCVVRDADDDAAVLALVENLHRRDLTPLETAEALAKLKAARKLDLAGLAKLAGKAKSTVSEVLTLAGLPDRVKEMASQRPDRFPQRLLVELAKADKELAITVALAVRDGMHTPDGARRMLQAERKPTPLPLPEAKPAPAAPAPAAAPAAPVSNPGPIPEPGDRVRMVRGVPVRIAADGSLHATVWNYCPVSHTGYRSGATTGYDPTHWTPEALEELAKEEDKERAAEMREAAQAIKRVEPFFDQGGPLVNPIDIGLGLASVLAGAVAWAWLAPENDQAKLLALAAELAESLFRLPQATRKHAAWTPERWETYRATFADWPRAIAQARETGEWRSLALAYRPGRGLPEVVAAALGIERFAEAARPEEAADQGAAPDAGEEPLDNEDAAPDAGQEPAPADGGGADLAAEAAARRADRHAKACADHAWELVAALGHLEAARLGKGPHGALKAGLTVLAKAAEKALAELKDHPPASGGGEGRA